MFFVLFPHYHPPPARTLPLPPCFLFEWGYPCERLSFLVLFSPLLGRLSTSDALLFNPPLIPFTLSFTSLRAPRRRKRCLCSNYSRPWSDWATPPPTTTPQETATQGFFFFSVYPPFPVSSTQSLRKWTGEKSAHSGFCLSPPPLCYPGPFTSPFPRFSHLPSRTCAFHIPAETKQKKKGPGLRHEFEGVPLVPAGLFKSAWNILLW